jgi:NAD-dependent deacetylase
MNIDNWITAVLALRKAKRVVVFTGAGMSAESGIPTFRDANGVWQRFPIEKSANWSGLIKAAVANPRSVAEFILAVVEPISQASANSGHAAVAELPQHVETCVVTQNIDGLHQEAGSLNVYEVHGSLLEVVDSSTGELIKRFERNDLRQIAGSIRDYVYRRRSLISLFQELRRTYPFDWRARRRPNLVLFGDTLAEPAWTQALAAVDECDLLISVGTSWAVHPAGMLPGRAHAQGATVVTVDLLPQDYCWLEGKAGTILPKLLSDAFGKRPLGQMQMH